MSTRYLPPRGKDVLVMTRCLGDASFLLSTKTRRNDANKARKHAQKLRTQQLLNRSRHRVRISDTHCSLYKRGTHPSACHETLPTALSAVRPTHWENCLEVSPNLRNSHCTLSVWQALNAHSAAVLYPVSHDVSVVCVILPLPPTGNTMWSLLPEVTALSRQLRSGLLLSTVKSISLSWIAPSLSPLKSERACSSVAMGATARLRCHARISIKPFGKSRLLLSCKLWRE